MDVYLEALENIRLGVLNEAYKKTTDQMLNPMDFMVQAYFKYGEKIPITDLTVELLKNRNHIAGVKNYIENNNRNYSERWVNGGTMPDIPQLPTTATGDFQSGTQTAPNPITYGDVLKNIQGLGMFQSGSSAIEQALERESATQTTSNPISYGDVLKNIQGLGMFQSGSSAIEQAITTEINTRLQKGEKIEDIIKFIQASNITDKSLLEKLVTYATYEDYKRSITNMVNRGDKIDAIKEFIYSLPILQIQKDELTAYATKAISDKAIVEKGAFGGNPAAYAAELAKKTAEEVKKTQNPVPFNTLVKKTIQSQILDAAYPYANKVGFTSVEDEHKARKQLSDEERQQKIKELWDVAKDAAFFALAIL